VKKTDFVHFGTLCYRKQSVQVHAAAQNKVYVYILFEISIANTEHNSSELDEIEVNNHIGTIINKSSR
jgi:hypothetical protein